MSSGVFLFLTSLEILRCCHLLKPSVPRKPTMLAYHLSLGILDASNARGDVTLPLLKGRLLVLGGPVECRWLEYKLSCHCAVNILTENGLERNQILDMNFNAI